ncbi:hypothetical protein [Vibrio phage vB_VibM_10AMN]|uniref:Uncharacterized protein n=1 Tax=Staphylococcus phage vB_VibM_10AMN12 TaxID=3076785 RepID=A0AA96KTM1_9CAUD|nr:hypothetical protein [Vibrio phage vB_VibM_10AMN]WNO47580.1 hypothetical protein [Staphylococcus phage vB_VibM_10AMN12]
MQDNTETIKSDIVTLLEMLYDSCHLTRDNVTTDVRKILAKHLGDEYDSVYNVKVGIKSLGNRGFIVDAELEEL